APEIIGMAVLYHYMNRMVSVFLSETPLPSNRGWLKGALKRIAGWYFSLSVKRSKSQGVSLKFLPASELPLDLIWSQDSPYVAKAFAQLSSVIDEIGKNSLADSIRHCVQKYVNEWNGEPPGMSRQWAEQAIYDLDDKLKEAGRLVLISAIAPYQVDEQMIVRFRDIYPEDETLLGALAWGSFTAAKRIGTWLYTPFSNY
ncbi:MAG: alkylhydroperoxidase, partial [Candidatus Heimdallarchaeota archaeon]|nr:alkylhydroperoxidase [Candidatus Heimdallarchaeota archaeon]